MNRRFHQSSPARKAFWLGLLLAGLAPLGIAASSSTGGVYSLTPFVPGGGASQGGNFQLMGRVAPLGIATVAGGTRQLTASWVGYVSVGSGQVRLRVQGLPDGSGEISWDDATGAYVLEATSALGPGATWEMIPLEAGATRWVTPRDQPARFYRLRQP